MKDIIFYGAGQNAYCKFDKWMEEGLNPVCFADVLSQKQNTIFEKGNERRQILSLEDAIALYPDYLIYCTQIPQGISTVVRYLLDAGIPIERIKFCDFVKLSDIITPYFLLQEKEKCSADGICPITYSHPHVLSDENGVLVYPCAPADNNNPLGYYNGNIPFQEFWNSGYGKVIKCKVKNRDFTDCALFTCATEGRYVEAYDFINRMKAQKEHPLIIKFMHDFECNLHCAMCRDAVRVQTKERLEWLNSQIDSVFLPMCQEADAVYFAGDGDAFASRHYRKLIRAIAERYPYMKFLLHTNGNLCDEEHCKSLGITGKIDSVLISINAATKSTYEVVSPNAQWERLMNNIDWIKGCINRGEITHLNFSFVVQKANFSEMADFARLAKENQATCRFTLCHQEPHSSMSMCNSNDVFHPNHPQFPEYCSVLMDPIFDEDNVYLDPYSKYIRNYCLNYSSKG